MKKMINIGIFGLGRGESYAKLIRHVDGMRLAAVCDRIESKWEAVRDCADENTLFTGDFDEFMNSGIDAAILCNYYDQHARYAMKLLARGIHVLSETASSVSMAESVKLCRACEQGKSIYMLAENYPFMAGPLEMKRVFETGTLGQTVYCEGEYVHPMSSHERNALCPDPMHWRAWEPTTYYNTHSLAPIMYITGAYPTEVNCRAIYTPSLMKGTVRRNPDAAGISLCTMSDGSVCRIMGHGAFAGHGNWYRVSGLDGAIETVRGHENMVRLCYNDWSKPEGAECVSEYEAHFSEHAEDAAAAGHGGGDFWVLYEFSKCVRENRHPYFDVYRATTMASVGILSWRSALEDGKTYKIPDFRREEDRVLYENDTLCPYPDENGVSTVPPCSNPDYAPSADDIAAAQSEWKSLGYIK